MESQVPGEIVEGIHGGSPGGIPEKKTPEKFAKESLEIFPK